MGTKREKAYFYILTNKGKNVLYAGSTKNLAKRIQEHKNGYQKGFTQKYRVSQLLYYEICEDIGMAKSRERTVKGWRRQKKIELIESRNKQWQDLSDTLE